MESVAQPYSLYVTDSFFLNYSESVRSGSVDFAFFERKSCDLLVNSSRTKKFGGVIANIVKFRALDIESR